MKKKVLSVCLGLFASQLAIASDRVYSQPWDGQSQFGPSIVSLSSATVNSEAGDDFELKASIDKIVVHGERFNFSSTTLPPISGAYVRFYSWANGFPGTKLYERFVSSGPSLSITPIMDTVSITLPAAFSATGKHFVTVQLITDEGWYWFSSNMKSLALTGAPAVVRDNLNGGTWTHPDTMGAHMDGAFELYGTLTGPPVISGVSLPSVARSGRLRIQGSSFGNVRGTVIIGGLPSPVSVWSSNQITAYVPEAAPVGNNSLQVATAAGTSQAVTLGVTTRTASGRIKWRFEVDAPYTSSGPATGPDGSIYVCDTYGRLYALDPSGGLKWIYLGAGYYASIVSTGPDGTIYVGTSGGVRAINPNGTQKWWNDDMSGWMLAGPNVGPDGNIYFADADIRGGRGLTSLTPGGVVRWTFKSVNEYGPEQQNLSFGNGNVYFGFDQYGVDPQNALFGVRMVDGSLAFKKFGVGGENVDTAVGTNGDVYASTPFWDLLGFANTGTFKWSALGSGAAISAPKVGPDGTIYVSSNLSHLIALNQNGTKKWTITDDKIHETPIVDKQNTILVGCGQTTYGMDGFIEAFSPAGAIAWRQTIPAENPSVNYPGVIVPQHPVLTPDGATAYYGSTHPGQNETNEYTYLFAVQIKAATTNGASVSSQTVPSSMTAGQTYSVVVNLVNTGTSTWTSAGGYRLDCLQGALWNKANVALANNESIAPGQTKKFSFSVSAPATGGTYPMQWRMEKAGLQFGASSPLVSVQVTVRQHAARYVSQSQALTVKAGAFFNVSVTLQNVGTATWSKAGGFMLASTQPDMNMTWGHNTVAMDIADSILPSANKTFAFTCKAPLTPGTYTMRWRMYRSASAFTGFFGDLTSTKTITVTP